MKFRLLTVAIFLMFCVLTVQAQSGRRQKQPEPAAPVPTPTPEPTPTPKKEDADSDLFFSIGMDRTFAYDNLPFSYYDAVSEGCARALRQGSSAAVDISTQSMSRGDAIKKAKSSTNTYVILLKLAYDSMARSSDDLSVEFVVFTPGTAKVATSGRSYMNAGRTAGGVVVGPTSRGPTSGLYREQLLKRAGEDAGNRILKSLHLDVQVPGKP